MDGHDRSPDKVDVLIHNHFMRDDVRFRDLQSAIQEIADADSHIHGVLCSIRAHHTVGYRTIEKGVPQPIVRWSEASDTWAETLKRLRSFADQRGGQKLIPKAECARIGRGLAKIIREFAHDS